MFVLQTERELELLHDVLFDVSADGLYNNTPDVECELNELRDRMRKYLVQTETRVELDLCLT